MAMLRIVPEFFRQMRHDDTQEGDSNKVHPKYDLELQEIKSEYQNAYFGHFGLCFDQNP